MQADETVLRPTGIGLSLRVNPNSIYGAEVAFYTAELLVVDHVEETSLELSRRCGGDSNRHGILPSAQQHVRLRGVNNCGIHGTIRLVHLQHFHGNRVNEFGGGILGGSDHECLVGVEGQAVHTVIMVLHALNLLASLGVILDDEAIVKASYYMFVEVGPHQAGGLVEVVHRDLKHGCVQRSIAIGLGDCPCKTE